jgi:hypothetical protein
MATKTQEASVDSRMNTTSTYDMQSVKLGDRTFSIELIGHDRINQKITEWQEKGTNFMSIYASAYLFSPAWNPYIKELLAEDRRKAAEAKTNGEKPQEGELSKLTKLFKQNPDKGVDETINRMNKYERPSTWEKDGNENAMFDWVLEQLNAYKEGRVSTSKEPMGYYPDATAFYQGIVKKGQGVMSIITDKETGEMMAATFLITGKTCMDNSTSAAQKIFAQKIKNMEAEPENTLYTAEMFIAPEIHGSARGGNMIKLMLRQSLQWANANGFTNILSWTPGEKEDKTNPIINMEKFFNFVDLGEEVKGLDVKMVKGKISFAKSPDGPAQWGGNSISKLSHTERL